MNKLTRFALLIAIVLAAVLLARMVVTGSAMDNSDDDLNESHKDGRENKIHIVDGFKAVQLDSDVISTSGIKYTTLETMTYTPEFETYAKAMDIAPLVKLKSEYVDLMAQKAILQNELENQNRILKRAEKLHKIKSLSTRELEKNRADRDIRAKELDALHQRLENFSYRVESAWGRKVGALVLEPGQQPDFDKLALHESSLILVSLLKDQVLTGSTGKVFISSINRRDTAQLASYLDRAYQVSNPLYGESYYYMLEAKSYRPGMRLFAWIEAGGEPQRGLFVPEDAVIWYANAPWIYIKQADNIFVRKPLGKAIKLDRGWLLPARQAKNPLMIVSSGAQMLLSEEFKWAIPNEDDD